MIPAHVLFADPSRFDLETLIKLYNTDKEWVSYCNEVKESVIKRTFEPYKILHGVEIDSSNTLFRLVPLQKYLQYFLDLKEGHNASFPKMIPKLFMSKCKNVSMKQVYPTLILLMKLQIFMVNDLPSLDDKVIYPYQLLNVIIIYQALELICIEHQFKALLDHKTFIQATINKCNTILEETKHQSKKMSQDTKYVYYHCVRYVRRVKRMLMQLKIRQQQ